jgi:uncharacterized protein (TIRG00374 family)
MKIKLFISVLLLVFVFTRFPLGEIADCMKNTNIGWFLAAIALGELMLLSQALRWSYLVILPKEAKPKMMSFIRYTAVGYFFNMLAPGGLGGDAYRSVALGRAEKMMSRSVASVFFARLLGMLAIAILFWIGYMLLPGDELEKIPFYAIWFMAISTAMFLVICLFFVFNPLNSKLASSKNGYLQKILSVMEKMSDYKKRPGLLFLAFADSFFIQFLAVVSQWVCFAAIGVDVSWSLLLVIVPVTVLAIAIPVSFNGIGVREWSLLFLSAHIINPSELLASVLLGYAVTLFLALQGGLAYLLKK